jgi:hypothetical protein
MRVATTVTLAYDIIEKKFRKDGKGNATGYGLKIFP